MNSKEADRLRLAIAQDLEVRRQNHPLLKMLKKRLKQGRASPNDAYQWAECLGRLLGDGFFAHIFPEHLTTDGYLLYEDGKQVLAPLIKHTHQLNDFFVQYTYTLLNQEAGLPFEGVSIPMNADRVEGLIKVASKKPIERVEGELREALITYNKSVVDKAAKLNADMSARSGNRPVIRRIATGDCCEWCQKLAGVYDYASVKHRGHDVYRRHERCTCEVIYDPREGKKVNVYTHKVVGSDEDQLLRQKQANRSEKRREQKDNEQQRRRRISTDPKRKNEHVKQKIASGEYGVAVNPEMQAIHMPATRQEGKSYFFEGIDPQELFDTYAGTGTMETTKEGYLTNKEVCCAKTIIGVNASDGKDTNTFKIHHSKKRTHLVPRKE